MPTAKTKMNSHSLSCSLMLSLLRIPSSAQSDNRFINPAPIEYSGHESQYPTWYEGSVQEIQWNTSSQAYHIALGQQQTVGDGIQGDTILGTTSPRQFQLPLLLMGNLMVENSLVELARTPINST